MGELVYLTWGLQVHTSKMNRTRALPLASSIRLYPHSASLVLLLTSTRSSRNAILQIAEKYIQKDSYF